MRLKTSWLECGLLMKKRWTVRAANQWEGGLGRSVNGLDSTLEFWQCSASEDTAELERRFDKPQGLESQCHE